MVNLLRKASDEFALIAKYSGVSLVGFAVDAALLHVLLFAAVAPAWARVISLAAAMHVTFVLNGLHVFRALSWQALPAQWWRYMLSNGLGNACNYFIFVAMVSLHRPFVSVPFVALSIGSAVAWLINFFAARYFVFAKAEAALRTLRGRYARPE